MTAELSTMQAELALQERLLPGVSRTFALTIPELPGMLRTAVTNAYLLCRIADTIEDDPGFGLEQKFLQFESFLQVLDRKRDADAFSTALSAVLSGEMSASEKDLVRHIPTVIRLLRSLSLAQQQAIVRCVRIMCDGMIEFQSKKSLDGLESVAEMSRYCYVVAGVVGEMLTELFCDYSEEMAARRNEMMALAICFGQGLQMTNILKDVWEDRERGACWLPRSVFAAHGEDLGSIIRDRRHAALAAGVDELAGVAHRNLQSALAYTRMVPKQEQGIRRFCLWAIGLAITTLQKVVRTPGYSSGREVKASRREVWAVVISSNTIMFSNRLLRAWFDFGSLGMPATSHDDVCNPSELQALVHSAGRRAQDRSI